MADQESLQRDLDYYKGHVEHESALLQPWRNLAVAFQTQVQSGMIRPPTHDHGRMTTTEAMGAIMEVRVNQAKCSHPEEYHEVVSHTPMGSFTATNYRCTRCDYRWNDD